MRSVRLGAFPVVKRRDYDAGRSYQALWERWQRAALEPLHIRGTLVSGYVPSIDGALHLDSILSAAVFGCRAVGNKVCDSDLFVLPIPVKPHWVDADGWPLWLTTDFRATTAHEGSAYLHSRYPTERADLADRQSVLTSAGRFKDVRMPLRIVSAATVEAWCIGVADEIRALLAEVTHIGKKPAHGRGRVIRWDVSLAPGIDARWILERRPVPIAALGGEMVAADRIVPRTAWAPPYWDARRHAPCRAPRWN